MEMQLYLLARPLHVPETGVGMGRVLTKAALVGIPAMAALAAAQILAAVLELAGLAAAAHVLTIFVLWRLAAAVVSGYLAKALMAAAAAGVLPVPKEIRELELAALAAHTEGQGGLEHLQVGPLPEAQSASFGPVTPVASHQLVLAHLNF
jgi:hypothetical protein